MSSNSRVNTGLTMPRSRQSSVTSSQENLLDRKTSTLTRKNSGIPLFTSPPKTADGKNFTIFSIFKVCVLSRFDLAKMISGQFRMTRSKTGLDFTPKKLYLAPLYEHESLLTGLIFSC